jgi:hypothetical protein
MDISRLTDAELLARTKALAAVERGALADLIEHLAEVDRRKLYIDKEWDSLLMYCVHALSFSEAAAYRRIRAARAIRLHRSILGLLRDGKLTLESITLLNPFLEEPDAAELIKKASGMRIWQVEALVAGRKTEEIRRDVVRFCPPPPPRPLVPESETAPLFAIVNERAFASFSPPPPPPAASQPSPRLNAPAAPPSVRVAFTGDHEFYKLLARARAVLRHKYPDGRLEGVFKTL